jgi:hypothetical protein
MAVFVGMTLGPIPAKAFATDSVCRSTGHQWATINPDGRLEIFFLEELGAINHTWQTSPGSAWSDLTGPDASLGTANPDTMWTSDPAVARNTDGRLDVFEVDQNGHVWHNLMKTANALNDGWFGWEKLGWAVPSDPATVVANRSVIVSTNADGRLEVFGRSPATDHHVVHIWQTSPGGSWFSGGFVSIGANPESLRFGSDGAVGINQDGRLEMFIVDDGSGGFHVWHLWQTAPNSGWAAAWLSLGGSIDSHPEMDTLEGIKGDASKQGGAGLAVGKNADGRLEVFARDLVDGFNKIVHRWQTAPNSGWSGTDFVDLGPPVPPVNSENFQFASDPVVATNKDGRLEVFSKAADEDDANVWHSWQNAPNSGWSDYVNMGGMVTGMLAEATNADGRLEVFDQYSKGETMWHNWQTPFAGAGWYGFARLGGNTVDYEGSGCDGG